MTKYIQYCWSGLLSFAVIWIICGYGGVFANCTAGA